MEKFTKISSPMEVKAAGVLLPLSPQPPAGAGVFPKVQGWERWGAEGDTCTHKS